jgi:hypothetical protein
MILRDMLWLSKFDNQLGVQLEPFEKRPSKNKSNLFMFSAHVQVRDKYKTKEKKKNGGIAY